MHLMKLTDEQWSFIKPIIPPNELPSKRRGRPYICPRKILEGVLWVLKTGARWRDLPKEYPSNSTCHRRFQSWCKLGVMEKILQRLARHLKDIQAIDLTETYIDASFVEAKKGARKLVKPKPVKALKLWQLSTVQVFRSPYGLQVLHHMRVNLLKKQFGTDILKTYLSDLWVTKLTTVMPSMQSLKDDIELNLLLPISQIEKRRLKMGELLEDIENVGALRDFSLGFNFFAA